MDKILFLIFWTIFQGLIFTLGFILQMKNIDLTLLNQLEYSVYISRGAGLCLTVTPVLLIFPMCRHTITLLRKVVPVIKCFLPDFTIFFHKIAAYTILLWSLTHTVCHYINFYGVEKLLKINTMFNLHYTIFAGISGHIMMIALFFIFTFSTLYFRRLQYEMFWYSHHFFILFFVSYPFHGIGCFVKTDQNNCLPYYSGIILSPFLLIYLVERSLRECRPFTKINNVTYSSNDVIKIQIKKTNEYKAGQYFLIKCSNISHFQWHAFTATSSPTDDHIEFTIRCLGDWSTKFRDYLVKNKNNLPDIQIDGAFGSPIDTICNYDSVILVASGIGITPYISILKYIVENYKYKHFAIKKIDILWVNRDIENFDWFNSELDYIDKNTLNLSINFHMYLTKSIKDISTINSITSQSIRHLNYIYKTNIPINYGRPNFHKFFNDYLKNNLDLKVGCFVCSSKALEVDVRQSCRKFSNKDVEFIFKTEKFS